MRNKLPDEIRIAKKQYFKNKLSGCTGNPKGTWKIINNILNRKQCQSDSDKFEIDNVTITDPLKIAEAFNNYFANVGPSLSDAIVDQGTLPDNYFGELCRCDFAFELVTEEELVELVASLTDASAGDDLIPSKIIKNIISEIKYPLLYIVNLSFSTGVFPDRLKQSRVTPIFKSGKKSSLKNYRPISILPVFSKILEKLANYRLQLFFDDNNTIFSNQHGFQRFKSTTSAILTLTDYILDAFDQRKYVMAIYLDFSNAFDTVNHEILLQKLHHCGVRGVTSDWFRSYLQNRKQSTQYMKTGSSYTGLIHSIPQGSILGPTLFNLYINDFANSLSSLNLILFADDSCLYLAHSDLNRLIEISNNDLECVSRWLNSNKLTLNLNKSHYMIFSRFKKSLTSINSLKIIDLDIIRYEETEFLGIILQSNLKWDKHISNITNKLNKYSSILYQIRDKIDKTL